MFSIAFGLVFMIRSDIGTSSWDSLHSSINQLFELRFGVMWFTVGLATIVVATTFMIMVIIMNKSIRYLIMSRPRTQSVWEAMSDKKKWTPSDPTFGY